MPNNINPNIFKAYDIRGKYPEEIDENIISEIADFLPKILKCENKKIEIIIGHDTRLSSPSLYRAAIRGIRNKELGIRNKNKKNILHNSKFIILPIGLATTPMFYFLVNHFNADGGIMITASHNPKEYNGLKIVGRNAVPISGKEILRIMNN